MSLKDSHTTSSFIPWDKLVLVTNSLENEGKLKFCLLIYIGMYTGLRIGDILSLRWKDILNTDYIELTEMKTKKFRKIPLNEKLKRKILKIYSKLNKSELKSVRVRSENEFVFSNKYRLGPISTTYVNIQLKKIIGKHRIKVKNVSSHSLRKSFGRRVWETNNYSDRSLILLSEILNHSSIAVSKRYLGIKDDEIKDVYENLSL